MSNIELKLVQTPKEFQLLDIFIGGNGIADPAELADLALPAGVDWRKGVILNGRAPIWLYTNLTHQCHPAVWVAVMDPRLGAIVIEAHHPKAPRVGSVIALEEFQPYLSKPQPAAPGGARTPERRGKIVAFVGPPHSGKSVLLQAIYGQLKDQLPIEEFQREVFVLRACPDGEGNWSSEIPPELCQTLRYKSRWDDAFVKQVVQALENLGKAKHLVLVDFGGKIDRYTQQILNGCTHGLIVSGNPDAVAEWRGALRASEVSLLAEIETTLDETSETLSRLPLRVRFGRLERGKKVSPIPGELLDQFK
ncbi:MAG: CRISPR-associated protein Csx3 [Blastocatellales bacterium]|nr:CRISPR-associated protein Csx3 [Blastocatellales bacterium]